MCNSLRENLCQALPITHGHMTIRLCNRSDMEILASWPPYPWPYRTFDFSFRSFSPSERDRFFTERVRRGDRITLVCDVESNLAIGYIALVQIDWRTRTVENMSVRVRPDWCEKGIGTRMLQLVCEWWFRQGMQTLQLDVAASNQRAIRCYLKAGFSPTGEFWREAPDLKSVNIDDSKYDFLRDHVRFTEALPEIRFYWMSRVKIGGLATYHFEH